MYPKSATTSVVKSKRTFSDKQKERENMMQELKELTANMDLIFNQFIEDITKGDDFWKELLDLSLEESRVVDIKDLIPNSFNAKGDSLLQVSKFWFLLLHYKYSDIDDISLDDMIRYFNACLDFDQNDIRLIYNLFIEIMKDYPVEEVVARLPEDKDIKVETFREYHYKYLLDKCHLFLMLDVESPQKSSVYNVELYCPSYEKNVKTSTSYEACNTGEYNVITNQAGLSHNGRMVLNDLIKRNNSGLVIDTTDHIDIPRQVVQFENLVPETVSEVSYLPGTPNFKKEERQNFNPNQCYSYNKSRRVTNVFIKKFQTDNKQPEPFIVMNRSISFSYNQTFTFEGSPGRLTSEQDEGVSSTFKSNNIMISKFLECDSNEVKQDVSLIDIKKVNENTKLPQADVEHSAIKSRISMFGNDNYDDLDNLINQSFNLVIDDNPLNKTVPVMNPRILNNSLFHGDKGVDKITVSKSTSPMKFNEAADIEMTNVNEQPEQMNKMDVEIAEKAEKMKKVEEKKPTHSSQTVPSKKPTKPVPKPTKVKQQPKIPERSKSVMHKKQSIGGGKKKKNNNKLNKSNLSYSADISCADDTEEDYLFYSKKQKEEKRRTKSKPNKSVK
jgi:hypothetical protein